MRNLILVLPVLAIVAIGCKKSEFDPIDRTFGEADFTNYVSVGNSLTQGYADGGVYEESQTYSYPSLIAQQMRIVSPNMQDFKQPMVTGNGSGYMHLEYISNEIEIIQPGDAGGYSADASWDTWGASEQSQTFNNLGVSGITLMQCVGLNEDERTINNVILGGAEVFGFEIPGNPYSRYLDFGENPNILLGGGQDIQYIDHIRRSQATFFTCWLGNNDVLGYATSGGVSNEISVPLIGSVDLAGLSDPITFRVKYDSIMAAFNSINAKGVCATLPDVTVIPVFNTITVQTLKDEYGYDFVWIEDSTGTVRTATDADLILLTANDSVQAGMGESETHYLTDGYVLDEMEVEQCQYHTLLFNNSIKASAQLAGFPVVDMYSILNDLKPGVVFDGVDISPTYVSGGAFSLDGVHLSPRGYAIVANEFIKVINESYGSNIPELSIGAYRGVVFP